MAEKTKAHIQSLKFTRIHYSYCLTHELKPAAPQITILKNLKHQFQKEQSNSQTWNFKFSKQTTLSTKFQSFAHYNINFGEKIQPRQFFNHQKLRNASIYQKTQYANKIKQENKLPEKSKLWFGALESGVCISIPGARIRRNEPRLSSLSVLSKINREIKNSSGVLSDNFFI